ncbi:MAG: phage holin family protein [Patescibacteria group bacterium]|jgi:putative membrane protein
MIISFLFSAIAVFVTAYLLPGVTVGGWVDVLIVALVLGMINISIKPILHLLTFPITILTLGLFALVINALLIMLADWAVKGFSVDNFWWALLFSVVLTIVNGFLGLFKPKHA